MTDPREPVFNAIRTARGKGFTNNDVLAVHNLLDALGVPRAAAGDAFSKALEVILKHEGGFVNHPKDPGGMTNLGVTLVTWESYVGRKATEAEMRALTPEAVKPLYRERYWNAVKCDELPPSLALCVFDFAVNAGPGRAARYLQKMVGAAQDGVVGPATIASVGAYVDRVGIRKAIEAYQDERAGYYQQLSTFGTFGKGWLRRVEEVEATALEWAR